MCYIWQEREGRSAYRQIFERCHALLNVRPVRMALLKSNQADMIVIEHTSSHKCSRKLSRLHTSMCLSSSLSKVGYLSSLMKGLLRPVVSVRIPGLTAPLPSINSPSTSLCRQGDKVQFSFSLSSKCNNSDSQFFSQEGTFDWLENTLIKALNARTLVKPTHMTNWYSICYNLRQPL